MDDPLTEVRTRMEAHGFPGTLLPDCIVDGDFDEATGRFRVDLSETRDTVVDGIPVHYARTITGTIATNRITGLSGVKAKKAFVWVTVPTILAEGSMLVFKVGPVRKAIGRSEWG